MHFNQLVGATGTWKLLKILFWHFLSWVSFFGGDFHRYFTLCHCTYGQVADRYQWEKLAKSLSWGNWPKLLQRVFDLDPDASGGSSVFFKSATTKHGKNRKLTKSLQKWTQKSKLCYPLRKLTSLWVSTNFKESLKSHFFRCFLSEK